MRNTKPPPARAAHGVRSGQPDAEHKVAASGDGAPAHQRSATPSRARGGHSSDPPPAWWTPEIRRGGSSTRGRTARRTAGRWQDEPPTTTTLAPRRACCPSRTYLQRLKGWACASRLGVGRWRPLTSRRPAPSHPSRATLAPHLRRQREPGRQAAAPGEGGIAWQQRATRGGPPSGRIKRGRRRASTERDARRPPERRPWSSAGRSAPLRPSSLRASQAGPVV